MSVEIIYKPAPLRDQFAMHCPLTVGEFMRATGRKELDAECLAEYCRVRYAYANAMMAAKDGNNSQAMVDAQAELIRTMHKTISLSDAVAELREEVRRLRAERGGR